MSRYELTGKVALVTGGAGGIGVATSRALIARGASKAPVFLGGPGSNVGQMVPSRTTEPRAACVRLPRGVPRARDRRWRAALRGGRLRGAAARLIAETPRWRSAGALRGGRQRHAGEQQPAGADVGADHRADLRDKERLAAVDLSPALDQALGLIGRPDVLDGPAVGAGALPLAHVLHEVLKRALGGAHPFDRDDLLLE